MVLFNSLLLRLNKYLYEKVNFNDESSIREVQEMAINYAEVHPLKIKEWRELSIKRAWLPNLSIGVDGDKNRTIGDRILCGALWKSQVCLFRKYA